MSNTTDIPGRIDMADFRAAITNGGNELVEFVFEKIIRNRLLSVPQVVALAGMLPDEFWLLLGSMGGGSLAAGPDAFGGNVMAQNVWNALVPAGVTGFGRALGDLSPEDRVTKGRRAREAATAAAVGAAGAFECYEVEGLAGPIESRNPDSSPQCSCEAHRAIYRLHREANRPTTTRQPAATRGQQQAPAVTTPGLPLSYTELSLEDVYRRGNARCTHLQANPVKAGEAPKKAEAAAPKTIYDAITDDGLLGAYIALREVVYGYGQASQEWMRLEKFEAGPDTWQVRGLLVVLRRAASELAMAGCVNQQTVGLFNIHVDSAVDISVRDGAGEAAEAGVRWLMSRVRSPRAPAVHHAHPPQQPSGNLGTRLVAAAGAGLITFAFTAVPLVVLVVEFWLYLNGWVSGSPVQILEGAALVFLSLMVPAWLSSVFDFIPSVFWKIIGKEPNQGVNWIKRFAADVSFFLMSWGLVAIIFLSAGFEKESLVLVGAAAMLTAIRMKWGRSRGLLMKFFVEEAEENAWHVTGKAWVIPAIIFVLGVVFNPNFSGEKVPMVLTTSGQVQTSNNAGLPSSLALEKAFPGADKNDFVELSGKKVASKRPFEPDLPGFVVRIAREKCGGETCYTYSYRASLVSKAFEQVGASGWWVENRYERFNLGADKTGEKVASDSTKTTKTEKSASNQKPEKVEGSWWGILWPRLIKWFGTLIVGFAGVCVFMNYPRGDSFRALRTGLTAAGVGAIIVALVGTLVSTCGATSDYWSQDDKPATAQQAAAPEEAAAPVVVVVKAPVKKVKAPAARSEERLASATSKPTKADLCSKLSTPAARSAMNCR